jgi:hypothetical protein
MSVYLLDGSQDLPVPGNQAFHVRGMISQYTAAIRVP